MSGNASTAPGWTLAVDFGTTATTAAIVRGESIQLVRFGSDSSSRMPSGVFVDPVHGLLAATPALNRGGADPSRYVRAPKRHVGRDDDVVVGGQEIPVVRLVAAVLGTVAREAQKQAGGAAPDQVVLTHPARWAVTARDVLCAAAAEAGMGPVTLVQEPVAAGQEVAHGAPSDARVAVYDLGGGTFDAAVLDRAGDGAWAVAGRPGGLDPFGGETIDAVLHRHLVARVAELDPEAARVVDQPRTPAERGYSRTWWRDLRAVKEDLSESTSCSLWVPGTDHAVLVSREELEHLVQRSLADSVDELARTIQYASDARDVTEVLVCGDASRMPIVDRLLRARFPGTAIHRARDPKEVVARGAAAAAAHLQARAPSQPAPAPAPPQPATVAAAHAVASVVPGATVPPETTLPGWELRPAVQGVQALAVAGLPHAHQQVGTDPRQPGRAGHGRRTAVIAVAAGLLIVAGVGVAGALALAARSAPATSAAPPSLPGDLLREPLPAPDASAEPSPGGPASPGEGPAGPSPATDALAQRFSVSLPDPDCVVSARGANGGPAITCNRTDPDSGQRVASSFQRFPDAARARAAYNASVAKLGNPRALKLPRTPYYADLADHSRPTGTLAAEIKPSGETVFVLQSGGYVAQFAGSHFQTVERAVVDTELRSEVDAHKTFGAVFDVDQFAACWPNRAMLLDDDSAANFDCFLSLRGGMDEEDKTELIQLNRGADVRGTINDSLKESGGRIVKAGWWGERKNDPLGPYVVVDRGRGNSPRYEVYWGSKGEKQLMAIVSGNRLAAVERLWTKIV